MIRGAGIWVAALVLVGVGWVAWNGLPGPVRAEGVERLFAAGSACKVVDVDGALHRLGDDADTQATLLVFLSTECPIARRYLPELNRLAREYAARRVEVLGVLADPSVRRGAAREFVQEFGLEFTVVFDASLELARRLRPTHTPEAFVYDAAGELVYRGRIDNRFFEVGQERGVVTNRDVRRAIEGVLAGEVVEPSYVEPVGCRYEALRRDEEGATPTFARDIAPIIWNHCASCHRPGEVAPFSLMSYEDVAKRAGQIADVVGKRLMPPWKAVEGFGRFKDERRLSAAEIELIERWSAGGAPEGDTEDLPPQPRFVEGWQLGEPDVVVEFPEPFAIAADGPDIIRYFALRLPAEATGRYFAAFEFRPGNRQVVHHSITFLDGTGIGWRKDQADPEPGYDGFGGPGFPPVGYLGAWVPGTVARRLPDGLGLPVPPGSTAVVMMHYYPSGKPEMDRSMLGIHFAKAGARPVTSLPVTTTEIEIPAGATNHRIVAKMELPIDATALSVTPHMHYLGREMRVTALRPGETEPVPLIRIQDWDFNWQGEYQLRVPIRLPKGTVVQVEGYFDNSSDNPRNPHPVPQVVKYGQETTDEMCLCGVQIALDDVRDFAPFALHMMRQFIRVEKGRLVIAPLE